MKLVRPYITKLAVSIGPITGRIIAVAIDPDPATGFPADTAIDPETGHPLAT
jgi:hypothetical protein